MSTPPSSLSTALAALSDSITGLAPGIRSIAQTASNAQATASAAIPKAQMGTAPGDVVVLDDNGQLPALDGSQLLNLPQPHGILPVLAIELGHSQQANGGRGIDMGNWFQLDFRIGVNTFNGFAFQTNSDGSATIAGGVYLVAGGVRIIADSTDTWQLPTQMTIATGQSSYPFPGIYQYDAQRLPDYPVASVSAGGVIGFATLCNVMPSWGDGKLWLGFSKVIGPSTQTPLRLQGYMTYTKIG
ncbi:hypothetical protein [Paraburkholderia sp. SUR17]|uniref:hypothetical protein n=1 Tax=Paraburkholderia sp. SUR17 TaxID=3034358 RepID=UPI00240846AA|nr:hypothetical protein [Paraburkholderia sp. SUR17]WEY37766.1 hypothetical protein P2869_11835 [Paraburkholderia sp. SUR17]